MRRGWRHGLGVALLVLGPGAAARAQSTTLAAARSDLTSYDLDGDRTLATLRSLGPIAASGADAREARYLRAVAGADLHIAATMLGRPELDARLATALGVPEASLGAELRSELHAVASGVYRAAVIDELAVLDAVEGTSPPAAHASPRLSAMFALSAARAAHDGTLASLPGTNDSTPGLDAASAHAIGVVRDAIASADRAARAAHDGDPVLAACSARITEARAALTATELRVPPALPADLAATLASGSEPASGAAPDVVLVIDAARVSIACGARVHASDATHAVVTAVSDGCPALGTVRAVSLPASLPAVPQPIDALVAALGDLHAAGASLALAPTHDAPMHLVTRTLRSLSRAGLAASVAALGATDGMSTSPFALAAPTDTPALTVHVRLGGYAISRAHGRDGDLPRVHGASGLAYDHDGLAALARAEATHGVVAVDGMGNVPAAEVLRAMRTLASAGARVTLSAP